MLIYLQDLISETPNLSASGEDESDSGDMDERQVYLSIGGYKYVTTYGTLCKVFQSDLSNNTLVYRLFHAVCEI